MAIFRLYSGDDGASHMEELDLASSPDLTNLHNAQGVVFRAAPPGRFSDWHNAPRRQYIITLSGGAEIGFRDGSMEMESDSETLERDKQENSRVVCFRNVWLSH